MPPPERGDRNLGGWQVSGKTARGSRSFLLQEHISNRKPTIIHNPLSIIPIANYRAGWARSLKLHDGLASTYAWIEAQVKARVEASVSK